jgi:hypothetical protein
MPEIELDRRKSDGQDAKSLTAFMDIIDANIDYYAKIKTVSTDYTDEYTATLYAADSTDSEIIADDVVTHNPLLFDLHVNDIVRVLFTPQNIAIVKAVNNIRYIKVTKNWEPNEGFILGVPSSSTGVVDPKDADAQISISLTFVIGSNVLFAAIGKDQVVAYILSPANVASGWVPENKIQGYVLSFPQLPFPSALMQVLVCNVLTNDGKASIGWDWVKTHGEIVK